MLQKKSGLVVEQPVLLKIFAILKCVISQPYLVILKVVGVFGNLQI